MLVFFFRFNSFFFSFYFILNNESTFWKLFCYTDPDSFFLFGLFLIKKPEIYNKYIYLFILYQISKKSFKMIFLIKRITFHTIISYLKFLEKEELLLLLFKFSFNINNLKNLFEIIKVRKEIPYFSVSRSDKNVWSLAFNNIDWPYYHYKYLKHE